MPVLNHMQTLASNMTAVIHRTCIQGERPHGAVGASEQEKEIVKGRLRIQKALKSKAIYVKDKWP